MHAAGKGLLFLAAMCCFAGCTKTIMVRHYPTFYTPDLKSVAVLPFDNDTLEARAGQFLTERLVKQLMTNGTYKVAGPRRLAARLGVDQLSNLPPGDMEAAAKLIGSLDDTQAFITGAVTTFTSAGYDYTWSHRHYGYPWYGYGPYWRHYEYPMDYYSRNEARVRVRASMVLVRDGSIVSETSTYAGETVYSEGNPPHRTRDECLVEAARRVADRLVSRFAIVRTRVKVPLDKALRTADVRDGGKWHEARHFDPSGEGVHAVVSLPPACRGNPFRLEVVEEGGLDVLLAREFVWSNRQREWEFLIAPKELSPSPSGRTFVITLHSEYEPIKSRKITFK